MHFTLVFQGSVGVPAALQVAIARKLFRFKRVIRSDFFISGRTMKYQHDFPF
jgi:hypothetical protein